MNKELISVIMPTYNRGYIIGSALESLRKQNYKKFEVIIVDDGSDDNTEDVVAEFSDLDIQYIKMDKNHGANHARNVGIDCAKGEYLAFLDSDNEYYESNLSVKMNIILNAPDKVGFVFGSFVRVDHDNKEIFPPLEMNFKLQENLRQIMLIRNVIDTNTVLVKKECFKKVGYFDENLKRFQDWDMFGRILFDSDYDAIFCEQVLSINKMQEDSISKNEKLYLESRIHVQDKRKEDLLKYYEKYYEKYDGMFWQQGTIYFDRKDGFNEQDVQYVNAINVGAGKYRCECTISDLENIAALRYDPIEGQNCIITKCSIKQGDKELQVEYSSNLSGNTGVILLGPDPLIVARTDDDKNEITLQIEYIVESDAFIEEVLHNFQDKQNDYLKSNYDAGILKNQLDESNRKIAECTSERNEIVSILQTSLDDCRNERNRAVTSLQVSLDDCRNERDRTVSALQISLNECRNEKNRIASALQDSLDECKSKEANIKLLETEIEAIRKETEVLYLDAQSVSDMKDRQIEILNRELQKKKDDSEEIARYKDRCSSLEARMNKIEHTMSWRITKGLRFLGSKLQIK